MKEEDAYIERFVTNSPTNIETYTVDEILQRHFATTYKSKKIKIKFPDIVSELSASSRMKIARIAENHFFPPKIEVSDNFISFLNHFSIYKTDTNHTWREFQACLFATGHDAAAASALYLQNGPIARKNYMQSRCTKAACVGITPKDNGIALHFESPFDLSIKLKSSYERILVAYKNALSYLGSPSKMTNAMRDDILALSYQSFFRSNKSFLSLPYEQCSGVLTSLAIYLSNLQKADFGEFDDVKQNNVSFDIEWLSLPEMTHSGADIFLPYEDFKAELVSGEQRAQNFQMRCDRTLQTLAEHYAEHPEWNSTTIYTSAQLRPFFSKNTFEAAIDPMKNFITRLSRGKYQLTFIDILNKKQEEEDESEIEADYDELMF